ncbi:MAG: hypothetical protein J6S26_03465 [Solobacterium sp.]|nr:hypothetical protein [Solobacterium sp.]
MNQDEIIHYWHDVLLEAALIGEHAFAAHAEEGSLLRAELRLLWILHAGEHLSVFISDGEVYLDWKSCKTLSERIRSQAEDEVFRTLSDRTGTQQLQTFRNRCGNSVQDTQNLLPLLEEILPNEASKSLAETAERTVELIRHRLYQRQQERREAVLSTLQDPDCKVPAGLDEFEYIDWIITHPERQ